MSIPPLFTEAELEAQVAAYKKALTALSKAQSYRINLGGTERLVTKADLPEIRTTLEWLQKQRMGNATGGGPKAIVESAEWELELFNREADARFSRVGQVLFNVREALRRLSPPASRSHRRPCRH